LRRRPRRLGQAAPRPAQAANVLGWFFEDCLDLAAGLVAPGGMAELAGQAVWRGGARYAVTLITDRYPPFRLAP